MEFKKHMDNNNLHANMLGQLESIYKFLIKLSKTILNNSHKIDSNVVMYFKQLQFLIVESNRVRVRVRLVALLHKNLGRADFYKLTCFSYHKCFWHTHLIH